MYFVRTSIFAMRYKVGIDIGGTFTDLILISDTGQTTVHKTLSTPLDPSVGFVNGLQELAEMNGMSFQDFVKRIDTIVHGTTVATNALLTLKGAATALITTKGFRDALEMRRGVREEQYNNHYRNVIPLVPRYLRYTVDERVDAEGNVLTSLDPESLAPLVAKIKEEKVTSVAICFMNSFKNDLHERKAVKYLRKALPHCFVTASFEVLPSIRFYERVSTTVVSAYVGPIVSGYLDKLTQKLKDIKFWGKLLIMQSNGGVVTPDAVRKTPAVTVLSGPAAAPTAGAYYSALFGYDNCITVDMGGTSFDAAMVIGNQCVTSTEGSINRYRIALPSLDIVTIGAGGGSIGWLNAGGLLQMGPQSAGALPGPVCYDRGGQLPTCTDADLVLGYLNPDFFAGGRLQLNKESAEKAINEHLASKLGLTVLETAAGMYRIINSNMAQGVRQVSTERGYDPREFLFIVAGGAGSIHSSEICKELEIPMFLVPNVSSIFCAAGMLLGDLKHDYIRSFLFSFEEIDRKKFIALFKEMQDTGIKTLLAEGVPENNIDYLPVLDMRYQGQFHELQLAVSWEDVTGFNLNSIFAAFHEEHNRQFGYSLKEEGTSMELINIRLRVIGKTEKPEFLAATNNTVSAESAIKEYREVFIPESSSMKKVPVYDGDKPIFGEQISGPCVIEKITTSIFLSENYDCLVDAFGSIIVHEKGYQFSGCIEVKRYRGIEV
jgi:N-methylhydantoinase A